MKMAMSRSVDAKMRAKNDETCDGWIHLCGKPLYGYKLALSLRLTCRFRIDNTVIDGI